MVPWTGSAPRRARHLIPTELPRRGEVLAGCMVAIFGAHLLLAQLTLVLAVAFALVSKASRWRLWWLLAPAVAGLAWALAIGPDRALAGFTAGPSSILWHLAGGHLTGEPAHPFAGFAGAPHWLPRQFPVALVCAAAEAALVGWLDWLHTDEWAVPPPRPGLVAAARRALAGRAIKAGAVTTRDGCALGVVPSTGAVAELRWAELARGALIVGAAQQDVTLTGLQVVHAALRRRKPVLVLDLDDAAVAHALTVACQATGVPLGPSGSREKALDAAYAAGAVTRTTEAAGASRLWGRGMHEVSPGPTGRTVVDLGRVVRERSAALLPAGSDDLAARACADVSSLAADLRRIGVDGDTLVWVPHGERVPAWALAALLRDSLDTGVSVLIGTTSPVAAAELGELTGTVLVYRVADRDLAARLAAHTGTRLLPAAVAAAQAGQRPGAGSGAGTGAGPGGGSAADLVPCPVIPAPALRALGPAEFILAASSPARLIATGRLVPARLPGRAQ
jgi:hypothetical protein